MPAASAIGKTPAIGTFNEPSAALRTTSATPSFQALESASTWPRCSRVKVSRARQDAFADVFERLALGLADADDMAELSDDVKGAVEHGRAKRIDGQIDAAAAGEGEHRRFEILVRRNHDAPGAVLKRQFLLARRADGADHTGAALTASCVVNRPTPPPIALIKPSPRLYAVDGMEHVVAGQRLDRQRGGHIEGDRIGSGIRMLAGATAFSA